MGTIADHDTRTPRVKRKYERKETSMHLAAAVTREVFELIMERFEKTGAIQSACDACGVTLGMFHHSMSNNGWQEDYAASYRRFKDSLTGELIRRARDGVQKPVWYKGEVVGHTTEYSDRLLETAVKAHDHRFREHNGANAAPSADQNDAFSLNLSDLSQQARDQVRLHLAQIRAIIEADVSSGHALIPPADAAELPVIDVEAE